MDRTIERAYAKINLTLGVLYKRTDGYHALDSIMQTIDLYDTVTVERASDIVVTSTGILLPYDNTVRRAAERYRALTGRGNETILANLRRLDETGKPIEIRMIQVPGLNMERSDLEQAAAFLANLRHLTAVRLLACHHLAHSKYEAVGRTDTQPRVEMPRHAELEASAAILRRAGLNVLLP